MRKMIPWLDNPEMLIRRYNYDYTTQGRDIMMSIAVAFARLVRWLDEKMEILAEVVVNIYWRLR